MFLFEIVRNGVLELQTQLAIAEISLNPKFSLLFAPLGLGGGVAGFGLQDATHNNSVVNFDLEGELSSRVSNLWNFYPDPSEFVYFIFCRNC